MYTIVFPILIFAADDKRVVMPVGLARDVLTQIKYEPQLRLICPTAPDTQYIPDPYEIALDDYPGLSFRFLPWNGSRRNWLLKFLEIRKILIEEASCASFWHTCCSKNLWDLTTLSYAVGRKYAKGLQVLGLDSDPAAMLAASGGWSAFKAALVRLRYQRQVTEVDATIFVGAGVEKSYSRFASRFVSTSAVWLQDGDLANAEEVKRKFQQAFSQPIRIFLPSRLEAWKGVDDAIKALISLQEQIPAWELDIMGEGPEKPRLLSLARHSTHPIRFLAPVPYGVQFFNTLRSYHVVLAPTRGLEETRIVYDAAASGCVLIYSRTVTLEAALSKLEKRWSFESGNVASLANTILLAFSERSAWTTAGLAGVQFMSGRTIDEMHRKRFQFLRSMIIQ